MGTVLTLEIPDELARRAQAIADAANRRIEDAIVDWIGQAISEPAIESLPDFELLRLCDISLSSSDQDQLSDLLTRLRENEITNVERVRLDELMAMYRSGMVRKARAMTEAVTRGLRPQLGEDAAA